MRATPAVHLIPCDRFPDAVKKHLARSAVSCRRASPAVLRCGWQRAADKRRQKKEPMVSGIKAAVLAVARELDGTSLSNLLAAAGPTNDMRTVERFLAASTCSRQVK